MRLSLSGVSFIYRGSASPALRGVSFSVQKGETVAIIGSNGSGKTTLGYALCGIIPHLLPGTFGGSIEVDGKDLRTLTPAQISQSIGYTFQDPETQFVTLRVRDELTVKPELTSLESGVLKSFDLLNLLDRDPGTLSMGQKQRVALATLFLKCPDVILLDEPSTMLDLGARKKLISRLKAGKPDHAIVFLTHDLDLVQQLADRVVGLQDGAVLFDKPASEISEADLETLFGLQEGRLRLFNLPPRLARKSLKVDAVAENVFYKFKRSKKFAIDDVSLKISANWGIVGDNGSGKTTLLLLLAGLLQPSRGTLERNFSLPQHGRKENVVAVVFQNPNHQIFAPTIYDELAFALKNQGDHEEDIRRKVESIAPSFGIKELQRDPHTLSFGWRKIVSIAGAFVTSPSLFIIDEPEAGLDPFFVALLKKMLKAFSEQGGKLLIASHDTSFLKGLVSEVSLVENGRLIWSTETERAINLLKERYADASC